jgi:acid phosphatase
MRKFWFFVCIVLLWWASLSGQDDSTKRFSFAAIGDNGCGCEAQQAIADRMLEWHSEHPFDTVLMLGDNIYGTGMPFEFWKKNRRGGNPALFPSRFDHYYRPLLDQNVRFYAALGNHDLEYDGGKSMIADKARFNILDDRGYYSFEPESAPSGLVKFFVLNTVPIHTRKGDPKQLEWLKDELSKSNATWKIVYYHHPMYSSEGSHRVDHRFRNAAEQILIDGGVKLTLAGHNHFYSRMKPIGGITHITSGGGGRYLLEPDGGLQTAQVSEKFHFMYFEVFPDRIDFWAIPAVGPPIEKDSIKMEIEKAQ